MTQCNDIIVGSTVRLRDIRAFADDVWRCASGPTDTNAHLAVELADWWHQEPPTFEVYEVQEQPAPYSPYLTIGSPAILGGDTFGANGSDVVLVEAETTALPGTGHGEAS